MRCRPYPHGDRSSIRLLLATAPPRLPLEDHLDGGSQDIVDRFTQDIVDSFCADYDGLTLVGRVEGGGVAPSPFRLPARRQSTGRSPVLSWACSVPSKWVAK